MLLCLQELYSFIVVILLFIFMLLHITMQTIIKFIISKVFVCPYIRTRIRTYNKKWIYIHTHTHTLRCIADYLRWLTLICYVFIWKIIIILCIYWFSIVKIRCCCHSYEKKHAYWTKIITVYHHNEIDRKGVILVLHVWEC